MKYQLVFENTGDSIPFDPVNDQLVSYYLDCLSVHGLEWFWPIDEQWVVHLSNRLEKIKTDIENINRWLPDIAGVEMQLCDGIDYLDQKTLNKLHADWVNSMSIPYDVQGKRKQFPFSDWSEQLHEMLPDDMPYISVATALSKLNLLEDYDTQINQAVHAIEKAFDDIKFTSSKEFKIIGQNHFPKNLLTNDIANVSLTFHHLGRTLYNKFIKFDGALEWQDENSYEEFLPYVTLSLQPFESIPYSNQYIDWCKSHGREPIGHNFNLGTIPNLLENLTIYRKIVFTNLLKNNKLTIQKL